MAESQVLPDSTAPQSPAETSKETTTEAAEQPSTPPRKRATRDQRIQIDTMRRLGHTYEFIASFLGVTQRQVQYACNTRQLTPQHKKAGRPRKSSRDRANNETSPVAGSKIQKTTRRKVHTGGHVQSQNLDEPAGSSRDPAKHSRAGPRPNYELAQLEHDNHDVFLPPLHPLPPNPPSPPSPNPPSHQTTMSDLRQRKPVPDATSPTHAGPDDKSKPRRAPSAPTPNLEPSLPIMLTLLISFLSLFALGFAYKESNARAGAFAHAINKRFPLVESLLNRPVAQATPLFGAAAQTPPETSAAIEMTETELRAFDGTDPDKPILLAINGTIYDVSASPAFYGPGGHYHHFVGRDASRAWVTECWDGEEQLTWRMEGVEAMFMPRWIDEQLEAAAAGEIEEGVLGDLKKMPKDMIANMAKKAIDRFGTVGEEEVRERRVKDKEEAGRLVEETLGKWVGFFSKSEKYKTVGTVVREERDEPPAPCEEAMKKRPIKGGKLESLMGTLGKMMGGEKKKGEAKMPDFVKEQLTKAKEKVVSGEDDGHEEL